MDKLVSVTPPPGHVCTKRPNATYNEDGRITGIKVYVEKVASLKSFIPAKQVLNRPGIRPTRGTEDE